MIGSSFVQSLKSMIPDMGYIKIWASSCGSLLVKNQKDKSIDILLIAGVDVETYHREVKQKGEND